MTVSNQATRIIAKFGAAGIRLRELATMLDCAPSQIYRWTYPKEKGGTGGLIPSAPTARIKEIAELMGLDLTAEDWQP